jgi:activating signal cointegrator 1
MKVITVIQPWATLLALGVKKFETRSWATKHRGELAVHAGKKIDKAACRREPIRTVLAKQTNLYWINPSLVVIVCSSVAPI